MLLENRFAPTHYSLCLTLMHFSYYNIRVLCPDFSEHRELCPHAQGFRCSADPEVRASPPELSAPGQSHFYASVCLLRGPKGHSKQDVSTEPEFVLSQLASIHQMHLLGNSL